MSRSSPDGHLHLAPLPTHEQLGQIVEVQVLVGHQVVEHVLDARVLRTERLLEPFAERLQIEEVEIEQAIERGVIAVFLDQGRGERGLERLAIGQSHFRAGGQRVERLRRRDADLGAAQIADELEDSLVQVASPPGPCRASP
jgi:hypothetical protein